MAASSASRAAKSRVAVGVAAVDGPVDHVAAVGLEMALEAPDHLGDAEGLVAAGGAGQQRDGVRREIERVLVPLHRRESDLGIGEQGVGGGLGRRGQLDHAELGCGPQTDLGPPGAGEQLAAQADAEDGLAGRGIVAGEVEQGGEVAAELIVVGVHGPAQDQEAVMTGGILRQVDAGLRVERRHLGGARRHPLADESGRRGRVMLEDQDAWAHGVLRGDGAVASRLAG